jgi:hypothetical protein
MDRSSLELKACISRHHHNNVHKPESFVSKDDASDLPRNVPSNM